MSTQKTKAPNPVDVHVGRRIRIRRTLCGLSQTELADELALTFQQLQKYESGANRVAASRLWHIGKILETPIASTNFARNAKPSSSSARSIVARRRFNVVFGRC